MWIQLLNFPFGLCRLVVVVSPVVLQVVVISSMVSAGRSVLIPLTSAFLLCCVLCRIMVGVGLWW